VREGAGLGGVFDADSSPEIIRIGHTTLKADAVCRRAHGGDGAGDIEPVIAPGGDGDAGLYLQRGAHGNLDIANDVVGAVCQSPHSRLLAADVGGQKCD